MREGFAYFQGYFFRRPETVKTHAVPGNQVNYIKMLQVVSKPELEPREIENAIKGEASLCYRLLRYMNSASFGFASEIHSVRHALSMLGEREVRRWVRLVVTLAAGQNKSSDLVLSALVRARFCELLSPKIKHGESDLFLLGLLSLMDSILELPMTAVLEKVPLDQETKAVLLGEESDLRPLYQLMLAQESGDWQNTAVLAKSLKLTESEVAEFHWNAMQWISCHSSASWQPHHRWTKTKTWSGRPEESYWISRMTKETGACSAWTSRTRTACPLRYTSSVDKAGASPLVQPG